MIPMLPANDVSTVRAFFVIRLLRLSDSAVLNDIERFPLTFFLDFAEALWHTVFFAVPSISGFANEKLFTSDEETLPAVAAES